MCNPPFYSNPEDLLASAAAKSRPPYSACTGAEIEMVTPGGEVQFVGRMVDESLVLKERCQWYTSMLGKLGSVGDIVEKLKSAGVTNWAVTEFVQGGKTRRWAVAWSHGLRRPKQVATMGLPPFAPTRYTNFVRKEADGGFRSLREAYRVYPNIFYHFLPNTVSASESDRGTWQPSA
jgi:23S rRNA A1618 N6-methylase RlmF